MDTKIYKQNFYKLTHKSKSLSGRMDKGIGHPPKMDHEKPVIFQNANFSLLKHPPLSSISVTDTKMVESLEEWMGGQSDRYFLVRRSILTPCHWQDKLIQPFWKIFWQET